MCLTKVSSTYERGSGPEHIEPRSKWEKFWWWLIRRKSGEGYKVIRQHSLDYRQYRLPCINDWKYVRGRWYKANVKRLMEEDGYTEYDSGFHVFMSKYDAKAYLIWNLHSEPWLQVVKVKYRNIVAIGKQSNDDKDVTVVADELWID